MASFSNEVAFGCSNLNVDMESYLSQHDIVYLTPGTQGNEGFPLGNGDLGVMAWTPADRLHFQINKSNTWDDGTDGPFGAWDDGNRANTYTYLRHCGEISIEPGLPLFDRIYLEDFKGRLSLAEAKATWSTKTPMGQADCSCFVARDPAVIVLNYSDNLKDSTMRKVSIARWGTRAFEHWYSIVKRDNLMGPEGLEVGIDGDEMWLVQPTRSLNFALAAKIVGTGYSAKTYNSRQVGFEFETKEECNFTLYLAVFTSEESEDPLGSARRAVRQAAKEGEQAVFEKHKTRWLDFWSKSFIKLQDNYLENLWYINLYQAGSSSLGQYPPHFISSLWSWNRDIRPWTHYYNWNQQCYTWPLLASGHPELLEPYAKWRLEGLPHAIEDAKSVHNCEGAFYSDVANRRGFQDVVDPKDYKPTPDDKWLKTYAVPTGFNLTPGGQIAHDLYRHYQYTLDEDFLIKYTYPILKEWVRFMLNYVVKEDDGLYHIPRSDPYESVNIGCKDATNTLAYVRLLFPLFAKTAEKIGKDIKLASHAKEVFDKLAEFVYMDLPDDIDFEEDGKTGRTVAVGGSELETGEPLYRDSKLFEGHYVNFLICAQLTPIFPAGLIGAEQEGTRDFEVFKNTIRYCLPMDPNGHTPIPNWWVRMGFSEQIYDVLKDWAINHQAYRQGLWIYWQKRYAPVLKEGKYEPQGYAADFLNVGATNYAKVIGKEEYLDVPKADFAHVGLEAGGIYQAAVNDMLLAGYSDKIKVFPSVPKDWNAMFTLHAIGGFVVTSEKAGSEIKYVAIESKNGQPCCLINPWPEESKVQVFDTTNQKQLLISSEKEITFSTEKGHVYIIQRSSKPLSCFKKIRIKADPNNGCKKLGDAMIGKPRQY